MPDKKLGKRILSSKFFLIICLLVLVFFTLNLSREIINRRDLQQEIAALQEKIDDLKYRNQELGGLIEYFKTTDFIENEARTKLNLRKPGEKIIIIPEENEITSNVNQGENVSVFTAIEVKDLSNPQRWWNYFFKVD